MITEQEFQTYVAVRDSGATNMFDVNAVINYSSMMGVELTKDKCIEIMEKFSDLQKKYKMGDRP